MEEPHLRRAERSDIPGLGRLLYQVHKVHSDARPDLFRPGARKYTDGELERLLLDHSRPVFVAEGDGQLLGYAFCGHQQYPEGHSMTNVKTLYIDDLCVDQAARGRLNARLLYQHVLEYARQQG